MALVYVEKMKEVSAVIGGEGSGGIIYPELHYGRDALVGIALFLTQLAQSGKTVSQIRVQYPSYHMAKEKVALPSRDKIQLVLGTLEEKYNNESTSRIDGLKIDFEDSWVHIRASNTEPILRIYTEAGTTEDANSLAAEFIAIIEELINIKNNGKNTKQI